MTDNQEKELFTTLGRLVTSVNVIQSGVKDIRTTLGEHSRILSEHSSRFDKLETAVQIAAGRQADVIPRVIEIKNTVDRISEVQAEQNYKILRMMNRLDLVETQLRAISSESTEMKSEIKEIRALIDSLVDPIRLGWDLRENISELEQRVTNIEEKLAN